MSSIVWLPSWSIPTLMMLPETAVLENSPAGGAVWYVTYCPLLKPPEILSSASSMSPPTITCGGCTTSTDVDCSLMRKTSIT